MNDETREALIERIEHVEHDPCGRNTELYGPSMTENSILELCQVMKELINDVCQNYRFDSNGKPDPTKEAQTYERKLIKKVAIFQLINQVISEVKGPIDDPNATKRFEGLINNKIRSIAMSNDTVLTATYNDEERVLRDTAEVEYIGEVEDRGHRFMLIGHLDDWTPYEGFFTIYSTAQFTQES